MRHELRSAELRSMLPAQREERLQELLKSTRHAPNGEIRDIDLQIAAFEHQFGVDSDTMRREVSEGKREESWVICQWLQLLGMKNDLAAYSRPR